MSAVAFECKSLGFSCEWALRANTPREVVERVTDHLRCAHNTPELSVETLRKVEAAIHPV